MVQLMSGYERLLALHLGRTADELASALRLEGYLPVSKAEMAEALRDHDHQPHFDKQPGPEVIGSLLSVPLRIRRDHLTVTALIDGDEPNYVGCAAAIF